MKQAGQDFNLKIKSYYYERKHDILKGIIGNNNNKGLEVDTSRLKSLLQLCDIG